MAWAYEVHVKHDVCATCRMDAAIMNGRAAEGAQKVGERLGKKGPPPAPNRVRKGYTQSSY